MVNETRTVYVHMYFDLLSMITFFVWMLQGLVEGLVDVSMSSMKLSSRLDFFFIVYLPVMSLIQMIVFLD